MSHSRMISFSKPTQLLVFWIALELWKKKMRFKTKFVWLHVIQVHIGKEEVFLYHECYVLIAI
jgi:hypothetical protein